MKTRDQFLKEYRGEMLGLLSSELTTEEFFQNQTLRPILKLQNDLLISIFKNYIAKSKTDFNNLKLDKKLEFVEKSIQRDNNFRNIVLGITIGLFTTTEIQIYYQTEPTLLPTILCKIVTKNLSINILENYLLL